MTKHSPRLARKCRACAETFPVIKSSGAQGYPGLFTLWIWRLQNGQNEGSGAHLGPMLEILMVNLPWNFDILCMKEVTTDFWVNFRWYKILNISFLAIPYIKLYSKIISSMRPERSHKTNVAPSGVVIYLSVPRWRECQALSGWYTKKGKPKEIPKNSRNSPIISALFDKK